MTKSPMSRWDAVLVYFGLRSAPDEPVVPPPPTTWRSRAGLFLFQAVVFGGLTYVWISDDPTIGRAVFSGLFFATAMLGIDLWRERRRTRDESDQARSVTPPD